MIETFLLCRLAPKNVALSKRNQVDDVAAEAEDSSCDHELRIHFVATKVKYSVHPIHCQYHEGGDECPNDEDTAHCAYDLSSVIAVRVLLVWRTQAIPDSNDTNTEACDVRKHVRRISHNRDRVRNVASNYFNDHEDEADENYTAQLALCFFGILQLLKELMVLFNMHSMKLANPAKGIRSSSAIRTHLIVLFFVVLRHSFKLLTQKN